MTNQIPPMPELDRNAALGLGEDFGSYVERLRAHARDLAARLAASQALAGEMAEALEDHDCEYPDGDGACPKCALIAKANQEATR